MSVLAIHIGIDPIAFWLGPLAIRWYGIGYIVAIMTGLAVARPYAERRGITTDQFWTIANWAIPCGLLGGRLYYVVQNNPLSYLAHPADILAIWQGGMAYFGAVIAAFAVTGALAWRRGWAFTPMLDAAALFAMIGQPIGRLGNVVNGDIVGTPIRLPWGFVYTNPDSFVPLNTVAYHPAAIYEIIANLVIIAVLFPLRDRFARGWLAVAYLAAYCFAQLIVFHWRSEPVIAFGLRQAQLTALVILVFEAVWVAFLVRRRAILAGNAISQPDRGPTPDA